MLPRTPLRAALAATALLSGCIAVSNDRTTIGRTIPVHAARPEPQAPPPAAPHAPSVLGLQRDNWQRTAFTVPIDGTYHPRTYRLPLVDPNYTERQRGMFPTPVTAIETTGDSGPRLAADAFREPFFIALDILTILPRAIYAPPWRAAMSPGQEPYQRWPAFPAIGAPLQDAPPEPAG